MTEELRGKVLNDTVLSRPVAQAGMGIGHAGAMAAAKVLAEAGYELMSDPVILKRAGEDFLEATGGTAYACALPPEQKPPLDRYRGK